MTGWVRLIKTEHPDDGKIRLGYGASITDAKQKLRYDLRYVRSRSVSLDMLILLTTIPVVVLLRGV